MKTLIAFLVMLLILLQYKLWVEDGGIAEAWRLHQEVKTQQQINQQLTERNLALEAEVSDLKHGNQAIEERARNELGMVKKGEEYYQVIEK